MTKNRFRNRLIIAAVLLRFFMAILAWVLTKYGGMQLMADAGDYELYGYLTALDWLAGHSSPWLQGAIESGRQAWFMVGLIGVFYVVIGGIRAVPLLLLFYSLITGITPYVMYKVALKWRAPERVARIGAWIVALSPAFAFWSGALYKEGLILLCMSVVVYGALQLQSRIAPGSVLLLMSGLLALVGLRFYMTFILIVAVLVALVFGRIGSKRMGSGAFTLARQLLVLGGVVTALYFSGVFGQLMKQIPTDPTTFLENVNTSRFDLAGGQSGFRATTDVSSPGKALKFLPVGAFYFLFTPAPWHLGSYRQNMAIPETAIWVCFYPFVLIGLLAALKRNPQGTLLISTVMAQTLILYSLLVGNIGTAYRLRVQIWLFFAILIPWGWHSWRAYRTERRRRRIERQFAVGVLKDY